MSKYSLLILKILAAIAIAVSGVLGIIGKSTDDQGNLTNYGKSNLYVLLGALIVAIITTVVEHSKEDQKQKEEQRSLADNINRQNRILSDIKRSFYAITSIDLDIVYEMSATSKYLERYKLVLDDYIKEHLTNNPGISQNGKDDHTQILFDLDKKGNPLPTIYGLKIYGDSPLFPRSDDHAEMALSPGFNVLITNSIDFTKLDYAFLDHGFSRASLDKVSDLSMSISTTYFDRSSVIIYSSLDGTFVVISTFKNAVISYDSGKIESILDLKDKYIVLHEDVFISHHQIENFKVREFKIQFNKSEAKNYNSFFIIKADQFKVIEGLDWHALYFQISDSAALSKQSSNFLRNR